MIFLMDRFQKTYVCWDPPLSGDVLLVKTLPFQGPLRQNIRQDALDAIKLAMPGFRRSVFVNCRGFVTLCCLPTRLEWAPAPDRGDLCYQSESLAAHMASGRLQESRLRRSPGRAPSPDPTGLTSFVLLKFVAIPAF